MGLIHLWGAYGSFWLKNILKTHLNADFEFICYNFYSEYLVRPSKISD